MTEKHISNITLLASHRAYPLDVALHATMQDNEHCFQVGDDCDRSAKDDDR